MRTGHYSLLIVALVGFSTVESAPEPDVSHLYGAPSPVATNPADCLKYLPPHRTCDRPVTRTIIDYETQDVSVPSFYEEKITSPKFVPQPIDVPNFVQRDVNVRSVQRVPKDVDVWTIDSSVRPVTRRVPEFVNNTIDVERVILSPRQYLQKVVNYRNITYKDTQVQFSDYDVYEHEVNTVRKEVEVEYIVWEDEEVLVNVVEFRQVPVFVDKYDYQLVPITVDVYELYDERIEEKVPEVKQNLVDVDEITYERRKVQVPRVSYRPVTVVEDKVEWSYPRIEVPTFTRQTYNVPTLVSKTVRVPRFQDQTVDVPTYVREPCSIIQNITETPRNCECQPCKCKPCGDGYNYDPPQNPLQLPPGISGGSGINKAPTPNIPILIPNPNSNNPFAFAPPTNEFDPYDVQASNVDPKVAEGQASQVETESESDSSWSNWLPTINAYRKKIGV